MGRTNARHNNTDFGSTERAGSVPWKGSWASGTPKDCAQAGSALVEEKPQSVAPVGNNSTANLDSSLLAPSTGPVFLEGRLVLSLSFQDCGATLEPSSPDLPEVLEPLERYEVWDDLTGARFNLCNIELIRFDEADVVVRGKGEESRTWVGQVDVSNRIILVPDLDMKGFRANQAHDLRWKRVWSAFSSGTTFQDTRALA